MFFTNWFSALRAEKVNKPGAWSAREEAQYNITDQREACCTQCASRNSFTRILQLTWKKKKYMFNMATYLLFL